jgi:hypothetical protein
VTYATTFFSVIAAHSFVLNMSQREQANRIKDRMTGLCRGLAKVTSPRRISGKKSDIDIWRAILKMFVDSNILVENPGDVMVSEGGLGHVQYLMALQNDIAKRRLVCKNRNALRVPE